MLTIIVGAVCFAIGATWGEQYGRSCERRLIPLQAKLAELEAKESQLTEA